MFGIFIHPLSVFAAGAKLPSDGDIQMISGAYSATHSCYHGGTNEGAESSSCSVASESIPYDLSKVESVSYSGIIMNITQSCKSRDSDSRTTSYDSKLAKMDFIDADTGEVVFSVGLNSSGSVDLSGVTQLKDFSNIKIKMSAQVYAYINSGWTDYRGGTVYTSATIPNYIHIEGPKTPYFSGISASSLTQ